MSAIQKPNSFPQGLKYIQFFGQADTISIGISLFNNCNLHCRFCFDRGKHSNIDIEFFKQIPSIISKVLIKRNDDFLTTRNHLEIHLMGGEMFMDSLDDSVFDAYYDLCNDINRCINTISNGNVDVSYVCVTNGIFTNTNRVDSFLKSINATVSMSYDPIGRFNTDDELNLMKSNFIHYKSLGIGNNLSITLTKETIDAYINGLGDIDLLKTSDVDLNCYTPNQLYKELLPSEDDYFNFYKWCVDNRLFNIDFIKGLVLTANGHSTSRYCICKHEYQLSKDGCTTDCSKHSSLIPSKCFYGRFDNDVNDETCNDVLVSLGMEKMGCLTCEHYTNCQFPCWLTVSFNEYTHTVCPLKRIYEYILNNNITLDDINDR